MLHDLNKLAIEILLGERIPGVEVEVTFPSVSSIAIHDFKRIFQRSHSSVNRERLMHKINGYICGPFS